MESYNGQQHGWNFKDIILSLISHKRTNTEGIHSHKVFKIIKPTEGESRMVLHRGWGKGEMGNWYPMDVKFYLSKINKF